MIQGEEYQRNADALLRRATATEDPAERRRLIDEALHWHGLALITRDGPAHLADDPDAAHAQPFDTLQRMQDSKLLSLSCALDAGTRRFQAA